MPLVKKYNQGVTDEVGRDRRTSLRLCSYGYLANPRARYVGRSQPQFVPTDPNYLLQISPVAA